MLRANPYGPFNIKSPSKAREMETNFGTPQDEDIPNSSSHRSLQLSGACEAVTYIKWNVRTGHVSQDGSPELAFCTLSGALSFFFPFPVEALLYLTSSIDIVTLRRTTLQAFDMIYRSVEITTKPFGQEKEKFANFTLDEPAHSLEQEGGADCGIFTIKHMQNYGLVWWHEVIQNDSEAYLVVDYMGDMQFKVRTFYSNGNIVVDVPLCLSYLSEHAFGYYRGPQPEFFRLITHASERPMINAHRPFHKQLLDVGMDLFEFHLKAAPKIKTVVQLTHTNRNYIEFGTGWNTFLAASGIQSDDLVFLELVPDCRITVMAFRWEEKGGLSNSSANS
ncbi:hypothetical protein ACLB2K_041872 [Fragaria x ananassa]